MGLVHPHGRLLGVGRHLDEEIERLGYPAYLLKILGVWKPLAVMALLVPGFPWLKEWTYAGTFFDLTGAAALSVASGTEVDKVLWALLVSGLALASWGLRPPSRTLGVLFPAQDTGGSRTIMHTRLSMSRPSADGAQATWQRAAQHESRR